MTRATKALSPEKVVAKARALLSDQEARVQEKLRVVVGEIHEADAKRIAAWLALVPEAERDLCERLLDAAGIEVPDAPHPCDPPAMARGFDPEAAGWKPAPLPEPEPEPDARGVLEPLSPERQAVARGRR